MIGPALEIFGPAALLAAAVALAAIWLGQRILAAGVNQQQQPPISAAVAMGFAAGYLALPRSWAALVPGQEHHWLPYLGIATAATASACHLSRNSWLRWPVFIALATLAAWVLTPSWPIFGVNRPLSVGIATIYFLLIALPLELLPSRLLGAAFLALLTLAAAIAAVAIGAQVSLRFAQLAAVTGGALAGCWVAQYLGARSSEKSIRGLIPVFAVLVGGVSFIACVEPDPHASFLLALPFTPLFAWLGAFCHPPARLS
jgi:hypothetical protein